MDFDYRYSEEQQRFRNQVSTWLDGTLRDLGDHPALGSAAARELSKKLGKVGWLIGACPEEFGGAGLGPDLEAALYDELSSRGLAHALDRRSRKLSMALNGWGTASQQARWLPHVAAGATIAMPCLAANPNLSADEITVEASRKGGSWVLEGTQRCESAGARIDYAWLLGNLHSHDSEMVMVLVPLPWPGLTVDVKASSSIDTLVLLSFETVSVPLTYAIGRPGEGWHIAIDTMLAWDHVHSPQGSNPLLENLLGWARGEGDGPGPVNDALLQEHLINAYFMTEIERIFRARLWYTKLEGNESQTLAAQHSMLAKRAESMVADSAREVFGPYALTNPTLQALQRQTLSNHIFRERAAIATGLGLPEPTGVEPVAKPLASLAIEPSVASTSSGGNDGPIS